MTCPSISIVIPTLNSQRTLGFFLKSIAMQEYPHDLLKVIITDGGSTDRTLYIVGDFRETSGIKTSVCENPLKTGEAGKAVGVRKTKKRIGGVDRFRQYPAEYTMVPENDTAIRRY